MPNDYVITSYSIHYTKLYERGINESELPKILEKQELQKTAIGTEEKITSSYLVITSYSIHYTKLYDKTLNIECL